MNQIRRGQTSLKQRGVYLVEVGIALVGSALFIMAVGDATRLYQARNAVRAAVHEGLRCLYPTDAGCVQVQAGVVAPAERRFDVFVPQVSDGYRIAQENIQLSAAWQTAPVYEVPRTTISVSSLTVQHERDRYVKQEILFPVDAHLPYVIQKLPLPRVAGADPLRPEFFHPVTGSEMSPRQSISLGGIRGVTQQRAANPDDEYNSRFKIGERRFSLSGAWSSYNTDRTTIRRIENKHKISVQCYQGLLSTGGTLKWNASPAPSVCSYRKSSNHLFKDGELSVPIMFHISGRVTDAEAGAEGKVLISISWNGHTRRLGGRVLSPGGSGNFVVRGASWSDIRDDAEWTYQSGGRYEREIDLHGTLDTIPLGSQVTLNVTLVSLNGKSIGWSGGTMSLFYPTFDFVDQAFTCAYSADPRRCVNPPRAVPIAYVEVDKERALNAQTVGEAECSEVTPTSLETDPQSRLSALKGRIARDLPVDPLIMLLKNPEGVNGCSPVSKTYGCDAKLASGVLAGCEGGYDKSKIPSACSFDLRYGIDQVVGVNVRRTEEGTPARFVACQGEQVPQCARASAREVDRVVLHDPQLLATCSDARASQVPPLRVGPIDVDTCRDNSAGSIEEFRRAHAVPPNIPVIVERFSAPDRVTLQPPLSSCLHSEAAAVASGEVMCGHNVTRAEVQRCCLQASGNCRSEEIAVGATPGATAGSQSMLIDAAVLRAVQTVQATYPAATQVGECSEGGVDCLSVQGGFFDSNGSVGMSARMTVPLTLLKPFSASGVVVEHSAERAAERALLWR